MSGEWYAHKPVSFLYDQQPAEPWQIERAQTMLTETCSIPLDDFDGHVGALTILKDHLRDRLGHRVWPKDLIRSIEQSRSRPGFAIRNPQPSHLGRGHWRWIDPATIARGPVGAEFSPYHGTVEELAFSAEQFLLEQGTPTSLARIFGHPRNPEPAVVVNSIPGPFGPVRPITENGNHRTLVLEALSVPLVLAKVHQFKAPYRCRVRRASDWKTTRAFLRWLESFKVVRLSSRWVVKDDEWVYFRIAEAECPWLASTPHEAFVALEAYERLYDHRIDRFGDLGRDQLEREWHSVADDQRPVADHASTLAPA